MAARQLKATKSPIQATRRCFQRALDPQRITVGELYISQAAYTPVPFGICCRTFYRFAAVLPMLLGQTADFRGQDGLFTQRTGLLVAGHWSRSRRAWEY